MRQRDIGDILGGLLMVAIGVFAIWYAQRYSFGTPRAMGPGFFPVVLGGVLAVLGVMIALPALRRAGPAVRVDLRTLGIVTASLVLFAASLRPLGLVPATALAVLLASLAERGFPWPGRLMLSVGLAGLVWLIFVVGLGMSLRVWPAALPSLGLGG